MSDPKRGTLITVGAPKSVKNNVNKTVRLTINLVESNESKYPELNYKELVIAEERKKRVQNGKTTGLDPFSDNDDDVARVARKFEQKYGGKSTYGRTGRSKHDDFADIGAGYDENDSFIDNTHGYDEMIPPECDTFHGGFYINSGSLEFKTVENQTTLSDGEPSNRRNKRRISSSSSEEESSESSSESSRDVKEPEPAVNGVLDSHNTEHRKKKNKKIEKKKAKKIRRTDSSAATSGKQTSDDHVDGESADSRTSQSDSLTSKPAPSSENAITSDSSRDVEPKVDVKLPPAVAQILDELEAVVSRQLIETPNIAAKELETRSDQYIFRLERALSKCSTEPAAVRAAWARAARCLGTSRPRLLHRLRRPDPGPPADPHPPPHTDGGSQPPATSNAQPVTASVTVTASSNNKRKALDEPEEDFSHLTPEQREEKIVETLLKLKALIDEKKPGMIGSYNAECERVREERKKIQIASAAEGAPHIEKRMPKRRFPWCPRSRALLVRLRALAGGPEAGALLLAQRVLPLFPSGFVRMPTLLRQADLSKEIKAVSEVKRHRLGSSSQPAPLPTPPATFTEPIQFPSSLTVTTTTKPLDKPETEDKDKYKTSPVFGTIVNSFSLSKDLVVEKPKETEKKEDLYIPPNNIGSITITPVPSSQPKEKKASNSVVASVEKHKEGLIRVKSPAALNEMVKKDKDKARKLEKNHVGSKEKSITVPLHVDTSSQPSKKEPSPKTKEEISQKQIESMRIAENNIPRPALVPVHHSPTFAKPDKRPPEVKKKKDIVIVSDLDPLSDVQPEPFAVDDSSSDVEVVEERNTDKSVPAFVNRVDNKSDSVPSKDKASSQDSQRRVNSVKQCKDRASNKDGKCEKRSESLDEPTKEDIDTIMRNIREMEHSQEPKLSNSYGGVITSAKREKSSSQPAFTPALVPAAARSDKDKLTERTSLNKMDGCSAITG